MSDTPNLGLPRLIANQAQPEVPVNEAMDILDVMVQLTVVSATATEPMGSPSQPPEGVAYVVPNVGTGVFDGHGQQIAYYNAGWKFITPKAGWEAYVQDSAKSIRYTGGSPAGWTDSDSASQVVSETGTNRDATAANSGQYTRFTNGSAPTYTFNASAGFLKDAEYHGRYAGVDTLTIVGSGGMTINAPAGGTLVIPPQGTFTVKIVSGTEADLIGTTVPV